MKHDTASAEADNEQDGTTYRKRIVVVGGGSAGCVMASRLSEDPELDIVLIEAGPDYPDINDPEVANVRNAWNFGFTNFDWGYVSDDHIPESTNTPDFAMVEQGVLPVFAGKVTGGGSSVNATNALQPTKRDLDRWVSLGATDWTWDEVLPYLRKIESDPIGGERHGVDGLVPVHRWTEDNGLRSVMKAFVDACAEMGHPIVKDLNGESQRGAGPVPLNQRDGVRQSSAVTYLAAARGRDNLTIMDREQVDRVLFDGTRATGVLLVSGKTVEADEVVLSAGSIGSPAILMRSGVGPRPLLEELGIDVVSALDGVGQKLNDHPLVYMTYEADVDAIGELLPPLQTMLVFSSAGPDSDLEVDLHAIPFTLAPGQIIVAVGLVRPQSTGSVSIRSRDPLEPPKVLLNLMHHPDDLRRLVSGVAHVRELMRAPSLEKYVGAELWPGPDITTRGDISRAVLEAKNTYVHMVSTCSMGDEGLSWAVVGQDGSVHGTQGLRVVDGSIMPVIPSVPTNFTVMMIAERCADLMRR
jgi:choline dehydrogenase